MPQPRKGNWVIERLEGKKWVPYYSKLVPLREALDAGRRLHSYYPRRVFRIRQTKNNNVIMADIL